MRRLTVGDVMTEDVLVVRQATPFKEIARVLAERGVSALPVLDENDRLVGVVSEADLLYKEEFSEDETKRRLFVLPGQRTARAKAAGDVASQLMTRPAITIGPDATVVEAAKLMDHRKVKRLPVVDASGRLVGIVSRVDVLKTFLRPDREIRDEVVREIFTRVLWADPEKFDVTVDDGVVTLSGKLEMRTGTETAVRLTRRVDGVVDVIDHLTYLIDDYERLAPPQI